MSLGEKNRLPFIAERITLKLIDFFVKFSDVDSSKSEFLMRVTKTILNYIVNNKCLEIRVSYFFITLINYIIY